MLQRAKEYWSVLYSLSAAISIYTIIFVALVDVTHAAEAARAKRVLIISTGIRFSAGFAVVPRAHTRSV